MKLYAFVKFECEFNFDRDIIRKLIDSYFRTCSNDYVAGKLSISHQANGASSLLHPEVLDD